MARCELIALDLDGTALTPEHEIAPETRRAIAKARERGVRVVIATGRSGREAAWYAQQGGFDNLAVVLGGAALADCAGGRHLQRRDLPRQAGRSVLRLCLERRLDTMIFAGERVVLPSWSEPGLRRYFPAPVFARDVERIDDPLDWIETQDISLTKLHVEGDPACFPRKEAAALPGVALTSSSSHDFELVAQGVDKGGALALLARRYGIPLERCAAVGDSENDVGMLRAAGIAVAMGNACEAAVRAARYQVADNTRHGAAQAIEMLLE